MMSEEEPNERTNIAQQIVQRSKRTESREDIIVDTKNEGASANPTDNGAINGPQEDKDEEETGRGKWGNKLDFILSAVGYAVGLGNLWRFPYLCFKNGGGAFLVPYVLMLTAAGLPLFFMELGFGQFASLGTITIWKVCPPMKGIGYAMVIISTFVSLYYTVIIGYTLFYLFASFTTKLPWSECGEWQSQLCHKPVTNVTAFLNNTCNLNATMLHKGWTCIDNKTMKWKSPAEDYWERFVLDLTDGIHDMGHLRWHLSLTLLLAWIVIFLCIAKGVKSVGKVVYFTATFPYIMMTVLLIRGVTLPGASEGIAFYMTPRFDKLFKAQVWGDAAVQIFYSLGPGWGGLITMASYNKFHNNCYKDAVMVALINCGTSIYGGFAIFSVMGFMAHKLGVEVSQVAKDGPGLAFVVYPEGLAQMPIAPFWSICFFFMLFTLGLDSQFVCTETIVSALTDEFPYYIREHKTKCTLLLCFLLYLLGLPFVMQGGLYLTTLLDRYAASASLLLIGFLECVILSWVYGHKRFVADIESMIGKIPTKAYWVSCWAVLTPVTIIFIFGTVCAQDYLHMGDYYFPTWSLTIGWLISLMSIVMVPIFLVKKLMQRLRDYL